ncbi:MAG: T9SS type A sorting domain-containing protein [Bacteroidales bacterium]|nr:T9SS type A sorting domain-containing protein [Bacteroidales bacterium]MBN2763378.1 T9SS type A sorting domain-containing protein [Bacteroidales bacterium]
MKKNYLKLIAIFVLLVLSLCMNVSGQKKVLFLGRGSLGTHSADQDLYDKMPGWGYTADYIEALPADISGYNGYIGIFINETIGSGTVSAFGAEHNYPIPCVCLEGWAVLANRWGGWVNDESGTDPKTDWDQHSGAGADGQVIIIKDINHYITRFYSYNEEVAWSNSVVENTLTNTNPVSFKEVNRKYSATLAQCKSFQESGYYTMVTVDSAEAGFPNRMFVWGLVSYGVEGGDPYTEHAATDDYFKIIERACEWAFEGETYSGIGERDFSYYFAVFPSPATDKINIRYLATGKESLVKASLTSITGQELKTTTPSQNAAGYNFMVFDVHDLPAGIYFVNLQVDDETATKKIVIE